MASGMTYTMTETSQLSTAEYYGKALCELGAEHKDVVALTADLAKSTKIGMFGEKFPDRFFNVGIAEQNMFGVAAGLAKNGLIRIFVIKMYLLRLLQLMQAPHSAKQAQLTILLLI